MDTQKLQEQFDSVESHLLSASELLQMIISTNAVYPIYAKEGKRCEKELDEAVNAFLALKKELGLQTDATPPPTSEAEDE